MSKAAKLPPATPKPFVPRILKDEWEYVWLRNTWLILPKSGVGMPKHTIKQVKAIINKGY